jgi:TldD protein
MAYPDTHTLFFSDSLLDHVQTVRAVEAALHGTEDGELYLEYSASENYVWDDGKLKQSAQDVSRGFGLRSVQGDMAAYAHSADLSAEALARAAETVKAAQSAQASGIAHAPVPAFGRNQPLYSSDNPLDATPFQQKLETLQAIDAYVRSRDSHVKQVSASIAGSWKAVHIIRADGREAIDYRPLVRLNIQVVLEKDGRMESGSAGSGGRSDYHIWISPDHWQAQADEALRQARVNMEAIPAPAGELPVVLGPGWCGVLLHEAVGHGLEGDFNRKGASTFSGRIGERVASKGVTVVDDGTIPDRRGSLMIDDEGTPTRRTVLIEDGILKGYMQDRMNARLMNMEATGNGRRESYEYLPMPRMTNTFMENGQHTQAEMIESVHKGVYIPYLGGGQVDITSGKFVFNATEAYLIEGGKVSAPLKGATLIGSGPDTMQKITMIGDDACLDPGVGTCGKAGQGVPVGVGQPSLKISAITVGGTAV